MENKYFYCYSVKMKDFLKSQGFVYITKAINPRSNRVYFMFDKSAGLDLAINKWNEIKLV